MPDHLHPRARLPVAMTVMKLEAAAAPRFDALDMARDFAVVITSDCDDRAMLSQFGEQCDGLGQRGLVVHNIACDDERLRRVIADAGEQPFAGRLHSPEWQQAAGSALADFKSKMEVGDGEPAVASVKQGKACIEQDIARDTCLGGKQSRHRGAEVMPCLNGRQRLRSAFHASRNRPTTYAGSGFERAAR